VIVLHEMISNKQWEEADRLMTRLPELVAWRMPEVLADSRPCKAKNGCALHAVSHKPAPLWLQMRVLQSVMETRPDALNELGGEALATPLHLATGVKQPIEFVAALVDAKADLNAENKGGKTVLDLASNSSSKAIEDLLEDRGGRRTRARVPNPGMGKQQYAEKKRRGKKQRKW